MDPEFDRKDSKAKLYVSLMLSKNLFNSAGVNEQHLFDDPVKRISSIQAV